MDRSGTAGGGLKWTYETGSLVRSSPTVADGTVFVGSWDNSVYALDAGTGDLEWTYETGGQVQSSPTVADGTVPDASVGILVDPGTGWSSPTVADGTVFVGSWDNSVYALDAGTGDVEWTYETGFWVRSSPTVADGTVFVGSHDDSVYALDAGVTGSSEGSRVLLGTLGHHENRSDRVRAVALPHFAVTIADATATEADENLSVRARVENTGDATDTQAVELRCEGVGSDAQLLTLDGGESTTVSFSLATGNSRPGEYTVIVGTEYETDTAQVTLSGPPEFAITDFETATPEDASASLDIAVEVTNTGTAAGTQTLELDVEGVDSATQRLHLGGGESRRLSLSVPAAVLGDEGTLVRASTGDDSVSVRVASGSDGADDIEVAPAETCARCGERFTEGGVQFKQRVYCGACVDLFETVAEAGVVVRSRHDKDNFHEKPYVVTGGGEQYVEHSQVEALARGKQLTERMETRGLFIFWKHGSHWVLDRYLDEHPEIARDVEGEVRKLRGSGPVQPDRESTGGGRIEIHAEGDAIVDSFVAEDFVANRSDIGPGERED